MYYTAAVLLLTLANPQGIFGQSLEMDGLYDYVSNNTGSTSGIIVRIIFCLLPMVLRAVSWIQ